MKVSYLTLLFLVLIIITPTAAAPQTHPTSQLATNVAERDKDLNLGSYNLIASNATLSKSLVIDSVGNFPDPLMLLKWEGSTVFSVPRSTQDYVIMPMIKLNGDGTQSQIWSVNTPLRFYTGTSPTERMVILNNGNVGIGTADPQTKLEVNGNVNIANTLLVGSILQIGASDIQLSRSGTNTLAVPGSLIFLWGGDTNLYRSGVNNLKTDDSFDIGGGLTVTGTVTLPNGEINTNEIANDAITSAKIADNQVGSSEITDDSVGSGEVIDNSIASGDLASDASSLSKVTNAKASVSGNDIQIANNIRINNGQCIANSSGICKISIDSSGNVIIHI